MKKHLLFFIFSTLGHFVIAQSGCYINCQKHCYESTLIQLNTDSTFKLKLWCDYGGITKVDGVWTQNNDTISLTTHEQRKKSKQSVKTFDYNNNDSVYIEFKYKTDDFIAPYNFGEVSINDSLKFTLKGKDHIIIEINTLTKICGVLLDKKNNNFKGYTLIFENIFEPLTQCSQHYLLKNYRYIFKKKKLIPLDYYFSETPDEVEILKLTRCK